MKKPSVPKSEHLTDLEITFDWPDKGWLIHEGKLVEVSGKGDGGEACLSAGVDPAISGNQIYWSKEAAEDALYRSLHPIKAAAKDYRAGLLTDLDLNALIGELEANRLRRELSRG